MTTMTRSMAEVVSHALTRLVAGDPSAADGLAPDVRWLDEHSGREVVTILQELARQEGCTIIIVTHDNRILDVADRIVNMVEKRLRSGLVGVGA